MHEQRHEVLRWLADGPAATTTLHMWWDHTREHVLGQALLLLLLLLLKRLLTSQKLLGM